MTYEQVLMHKKAALAAKEDNAEKLTLKKSKKLQKKQFKKDVKELRTNPLTRSDRRATGKLHSLVIGGITSKIIPGAIGATIGGIGGAGLMSRLSAGMPEGAVAAKVLGATGGVGIGAWAGVKAAKIVLDIARIIGQIRRVRTNKEQEEYESSKGATAANYLLPGAAAYNRAATDAANRDTLSRLRLDKM